MAPRCILIVDVIIDHRSRGMHIIGVLVKSLHVYMNVKKNEVIEAFLCEKHLLHV